MKRLLVVPVLMMLIIIFTVNTGSAAAPASATSHKKPVPARCTVQTFRPFAAKVWDKDLWRRGEPPKATLEAAIRRIECAGPGNRAAMGRVWRKDKLHYYHYRAHMKWRTTVTPFYYAHHWWAAPYPIALCESGGNYYVGPYGAYGLIMEPTWQSPREQDEDAHRLYEAYGESPWAPYESGCAYR